MSDQNRHIYVISDLHMGDGSARDNFAIDGKAEQLKQFAKKVKDEHAELIVLGDLFEFWQASLSRVLLEREDVLNCLADAEAIYVVGNHDADLFAFAEKQETALSNGNTPSTYLNHPFFKGMRTAFERKIGGKSFYFMHGHEEDDFNKGDKPNKGRALAILAGMIEDWFGGPFLGKDKSVSIEQILSGVGDWFLTQWQRLVVYILAAWWKYKYKNVPIEKRPNTGTSTPQQDSSNTIAVVKGLLIFRNDQEYDILVVGHTHDMGEIKACYFNSGGWAEQTNDVLRISPTGDITFHEFKEGQLVDRTDIPDLGKKYGITEPIQRNRTAQTAAQEEPDQE